MKRLWLSAAFISWLLASPAVADALTATVTGPTSVVFGWDATTGAANYVIQQSTHQGGPYVDAVWTSNTGETVSGLTPGATYYWIVRAVSAGGLWSLPSNEVSLTLPAGPGSDDCTPVTGLFAVSVFPTSLLKTGSKGPGSKTRFDFQVSSPNSPVTRVVVTAGAMTLTDTGGPGADLTNLAGVWFVMPASGTYQLSVTATNKQGCSKMSSYGPGLTVP
jgi:Fibronectin type III domain